MTKLIAPRQKETVEKNVYEMAVERTNHLYDLFDHVCVMFSGGKDSTVILNIALQVARERNRLPLRVVHFDEEAIPIDVEDYVRRVSQIPDISLEWYCVPLKHRNACDPKHPYWYTWASEDQKKWCRSMPPEALRQVGKYTGENGQERKATPELNQELFDISLGRCVIAMGIRADESITRMRAVTNRTDENWIIEGGGGYGGTETVKTKNFYKAYPIYDWTTDDVWTAPAKFNWDYCKYYDLLEMAKISRNDQRLAPPFGEEPFQRLWQYTKTYPELWEKMCRRVPGANTAVLYSKTALYGFRGLPEKPQDMSWETFLQILIEQHDVKIQKTIAQRVSGLIEYHYSKTTDPICVEAGHPDTGLSWNILTQIAFRGDLKNRKQPGGKIPSLHEPKHKIYVERYHEARAKEHPVEMVKHDR